MNLSPINITPAKLTPQAINSLRESVDDYLNANEHTFTKINNSQVRCISCEQNIKCAKWNLENHVSKSIHFFLLNFTDSEKKLISIQERRKMNNFIEKYEFLERRGTEIICTLCEDVTFSIDQLTLISNHQKKVHSDLPKRTSVLCSNGETPKRKQIDENKQTEAIECEIARYTGDDGNSILTKNENGNLMCICQELFMPSDPSKLRWIVQRHMSQCKRHGDAVERIQMKPIGPDGLVTPPKLKLAGVHGRHRKVGTHKSVLAAKVLLHWNQSLSSADTSSDDLLKPILGHSISPTQVIKVGIPELEKVVTKRRSDFFKGKNLWMSIDGSSDNRSLAAIVIGALDSSMNILPIVVKAVNSKTGEATKKEIVKLLEKYEIEKEQLRVLVTDSEPAIRTCGQLLAEDLPNVIHVFCVPHEIHLVAEVIKSLNKELNDFIGQIKQILVRSKHRRVLFKLLTGVHSPPLPHHIRWGTWIITSNNLYFYLDAVIWFIKEVPLDKKVSNEGQEDGKDTESRLSKLKAKVNDPQYVARLRSALDFNFQNYSETVSFIFKLESNKQLFPDQRNVLKVFEQYIQKAVDTTQGDDKKSAQKVAAKLAKCLKDNSGLKELETKCNEDSETYYKYSPLTSAETERLFGWYTKNFGDKSASYQDLTLERVTSCKLAIRKTFDRKKRKANVQTYNQNYVPLPINRRRLVDCVDGLEMTIGVEAKKIIAKANNIKLPTSTKPKKKTSSAANKKKPIDTNQNKDEQHCDRPFCDTTKHLDNLESSCPMISQKFTPVKRKILSDSNITNVSKRNRKMNPKYL